MNNIKILIAEDEQIVAKNIEKRLTADGYQVVASVSTGEDAIEKAKLYSPDIILMDEPFGSLDSQTRNTMQEFLLSIWQNSNKTILFVTHNIDEAVFLSNRVIGLSKRPGSIKFSLNIEIPMPRDRTSSEFNQYRKEILNFLHMERSSPGE